MNTKKFDCGCEFPLDDNGRILFDPDVENINLECPAVWNLISSGRTTGLFQIESQLGKTFSKKLKPRDIEGLALLLSSIRPGCLENTLEDGKNIAQHLVDRYNNNEAIDYYHPSLEKILDKTLGLLVFQESALSIVQELANFSLSKADLLRRGIGHKEVSIIQDLKQDFLNGCKKVGKVNKEEATHIFAEIEKSQRYSFNKCLSPDTIVKTTHGNKTLTDIKIGDWIDSPDRYVEVINKYDNGLQDLYEIILEDGKTIQCTMNHKFLCSDNHAYPLWEILEKNLEIVVQN